MRERSPLEVEGPSHFRRGRAGLVTLLSAIVCAAVISVVHFVAAPPEADAATKASGAPAASKYGGVAISVLVLGDSMTAGGFGEGLESYLVNKYGEKNVVLAGACGSSPENWLPGEPYFNTKCGFRWHSPSGNFFSDFVNGRAPGPTQTPKIDEILLRYRPLVVIVQQGTNWMDPITARGFDESKYRQIIHRFVAELRKRSETPRQIFWVTPPDASKYSRKVKSDVDSVIRASARTEGYEIIDSSRMTHYKAGVSGGDGVHYKNGEAKAWAALVAQDYGRRVRPLTTVAAR